jgi:hypothetical protein
VSDSSGNMQCNGINGNFSRSGAMGEVGADIEFHFLEVASEVEGPCKEQLRGSLISYFDRIVTSMIFKSK